MKGAGMWEESEFRIFEALQRPKLQDEPDDDIYGEPDIFPDEDAEEHEFEDDSCGDNEDEY